MRLPRRTLFAAFSLAACHGTGSRAASSPGLLHRLSPGPLICAHRGWRDPGQSENDLSEFMRTTASGPFMLELDLALTADGDIVLMHDRTVDRTTNGHGVVARMSSAALRDLHVRHGAVMARDRVPEFATVLDWAASTPSALLMLDIKDVPPAQVMNAVRCAKMSDRVILLTFSDTMARAAFAVAGRAVVSCLVTSAADLTRARAMAGSARFAAYVPRTSPTALFHAAHDAGAIVMTDLLGPTAVTDALKPAEGAAFARRLPIDIIVTNTPQALRSALRTI